MVRGNTFPITVHLEGGNSLPLMLGDEGILKFGVAWPPEPGKLLIDKQVGQGAQDENGAVTIVLEPADTLPLHPGQYVYDVAVQLGPDFYTVVAEGDLILRRNITTPDDAGTDVETEVSADA